MKNRFFTLITPAILLIGCLIFVGLGVVNLNQMKKFPEVRATVTKVEQELDTAGDTSDVDETVWVHYIVADKEYDEVLQFHEVDKLKVGDTITVRYNPEKPNYVTAGKTSTSIMYIAFGSLFGIGGLAMLARIIKNR